MAKLLPHSILRLWEDKEDEWKRYHVLRDEIKVMFPQAKKVSERTIMRKLNDLVKSSDLEKRIDPDHSTWYRPKGKASVTRQHIKDSTDEMSLEIAYRMPLVITRESLRTSVKVPKLLAWLARWGKDLSKAPPTIREPRSRYSAIDDSEVVEKWQSELISQFKEFLKKRHPTVDKKKLQEASNLMAESFFACLEDSMRLSVFSSLKLKPVDVSTYKLFSGGEVERGLYADVWLHLFETMVLLLKGKYDQHKSIEEFLKDARGTRMMVVLDVNTDIPSIVNHLEKVYFDPKFREQMMQKFRSLRDARAVE